MFLGQRIKKTEKEPPKHALVFFLTVVTAADRDSTSDPTKPMTLVTPIQGSDTTSVVQALAVQKAKLERANFTPRTINFDADSSIRSKQAELELAARKLDLVVTSEKNGLVER
jgi:hypothetical protein